MANQKPRVSRHNGRAGKHGVYNPKHNDRQFDVAHAENIHQDRTRLNLYWDWQNGLRNHEENQSGQYPTFNQVERDFYEQRYGDYLAGQAARNVKAGHAGRNRTVDDLLSWTENVLKPRAELAFRGEGDYIPGSWCTFCKAAVKCRARAEAKLQLARYEFAMPPLLTDAEIEDILLKLDDLTKWANEIQAYAQDAAINHGKAWHGFKLVESTTKRKYINEDAVIEAANAAGYTDIFKKSLIPITEMEKLMGKKNFAAILGKLVEKPHGKPTLVPASDKRPAITTDDAASEFTEITEE